MKNARQQSPVRSSPGFTLIEVLFAALAFAIVLAAVNAVFYGSLRLRERADAKQKERMPRIQSLELLKRDLRAAFYSEGFRANRFRCEPSRGLGVLADQIQFFARTGTTDQSAPWPDVQQIEYYLAAANEPLENQNSLELVRAVTRNLLVSAYQPPVEQRLVSGVSAFQLSFFDGEIWTTSWDSELQDLALPKAVQIYLEFAPTNRSNPLPPSLTQVVPILAEPKTTKDEETEATEREEESNNGQNAGGQNGSGRSPNENNDGGRNQE